MALKPRARVTAVYEISAKAAPALEKLLREELPRHISCTFLEVRTDAEQELLEVPVEDSREQQGVGLDAEPRDAGEDSVVAGDPGAGELEPSGGSADDGLQGDAVPREENGDLTE